MSNGVYVSKFWINVSNDDAVRAAEFTICRGASVGSIRRAFNDRPQVWAELCRESVAEEFVRSE